MMLYLKIFITDTYNTLTSQIKGAHRDTLAIYPILLPARDTS